MSGKFHISSDGQARPCVATKVPCTLEHFDSLDQAQRHYENTRRASLFSVVSKTARRRAVSTIALSLVASFSLSACGASLPDPRDGDSWKQASAQAQQVQVQEAKAKLEQLKEKASKGARSLGDKAGQMAERLPEGDVLTSGSSGADTGFGATQGGQVGEGDIFFQGRSLGVSQAEIDQGLARLSALEVRPERDTSDYNRKKMFGANKSSTIGRAEHRDITDGAVFDGSKDSSRAIEGSFIDPYTGQPAHIVQGSNDDLDLDHIVPLKEASRSERAEARLTSEQRRAIANDLDNLQMVASAVNRAKSDKDPKHFLPSFAPGVCRYSLAYVKVKHKYDLTIDAGEKDALNSAINDYCVAK